MLPYVLLVLIPAFFSFVAVDRSTKRKRIFVASHSHELVDRHNLALPIFFIILFWLLALRDETVGRDVIAYKSFFEIYSTLQFEDLELFSQESIYYFLNWFIGQQTEHYQIFLAVVAALMLIPMGLLYCEDRHRSYMKIIVFVSMSTFVMLFSGLRQMLAISCAMVAYVFVRKRNWLLFLVMAVIGLGFHHSAFIIFVMYPLYYVRFKKKHLLFIVPALAFVFLFNRQIFGLANLLLAAFNDKYDNIQIQSTGAYMSLVLFAAFAAFAYLVPDETKMDEEMFGLRNFLLVAVFLQCFAPVHTLAMRLNYYFIIFIPILLSKLIDIPRPGMARVAKLAGIIIPLYFTFDYFYTLLTSYLSGVSNLDTIPYLPFWA